MSHVDTCKITCKKSLLCKSGKKFLASDAFFSFADNIEIAFSYGIKAIITPGGLLCDYTKLKIY